MESLHKFLLTKYFQLFEDRTQKLLALSFKVQVLLPSNGRAVF